MGATINGVAVHVEPSGCGASVFGGDKSKTLVDGGQIMAKLRSGLADVHFLRMSRGR